MTNNKKHNPESVVREIKRKTRKKYSSEEKIRIVLEGLKGEDSISAICRREGIVPNLYYRWSKDFLEAGKRRLQGDTVREANSVEVSGIKQENEQLKQSRTYPHRVIITIQFVICQKVYWHAECIHSDHC